jgi:ABC-type uncharacterized transport system ATPase subunit
MKKIGKVFLLSMVLGCLGLLGLSQVMAAEVKAKFDVNKMGDMSDFDPNNPMKVTGDTIKIAVSILLVEHNFKVAMSLARRVYVMKKAQLAFEGTVEELATQHEIREKYLEV